MIKPADKGSVIVIMDREQYEGEAGRQLNNTTYYRKLDKPIHRDSRVRIVEILEQLRKGG